MISSHQKCPLCAGVLGRAGRAKNPLLVFPSIRTMQLLQEYFPSPQCPCSRWGKQNADCWARRMRLLVHRGHLWANPLDSFPAGLHSPNLSPRWDFRAPNAVLGSPYLCFGKL